MEAVFAVLPSTDGTPVPTVPHKPPFDYPLLHLRVKNQLSTPVWLIYNARAAFPRSVPEVSLQRGQFEPVAYLWNFAGNADAFRIAAHADVVLRGVRFRRLAGKLEALSFADELSLDGQPAELWLGHSGLTPARGTFQVESSAPLAQRSAPEGMPAMTAVHMLCSRELSEAELLTAKNF